MADVSKEGQVGGLEALLAASPCVVVRGAGDLASGVIARFHRSGLSVVALEVARPLSVRRTVSFSEAVYEGAVEVEGVRARLARDPAECLSFLAEGTVPILVDPEAASLAALKPRCVVDAIMAKRNLGTRHDMAAVVIGLGPGFVAGGDVHAVVETMRGHDLGRVIWKGAAMPDTGRPGEIGGKSDERVLRSPKRGRLQCRRRIGERIAEGEVIAFVSQGGRQAAIAAPFTGVLRGLIHDGLEVDEGMKVGDIDPRCESSHCFSISDKSLAVAGGALEAFLSAASGRRP
jgi:xanthine dehydrogenase accessory factor